MLVYDKLYYDLLFKRENTRVKIKPVITGDEFKSVTMMIVNEGGFLNLDNITNIQWYKVLKQCQIKVYDCSEGLVVSGGNLNPVKGSWCPIWWLCTGGRPSCLHLKIQVLFSLTK